MAKPLIAGNWKMHGTVEATSAIVGQLAAQWSGQASAKI